MKYTLLYALLFVALSSNAQEKEKDLQLGFTLSPTLSWLTSDADFLKPDGAKTGFSYGVIADIGFAKNYYFSTAFTLTSLKSNAKIASSSNTYKLQYIEIPFSLKLKSNATELGRFYGQFGLGTGINVSAKEDASDFKTGNSHKNLNISKDVNIFRLGLIAGGGAEWNVGRNLSVLTGVTFNNGFTKTFKDYESKNPFVTLNLGIFF